MFDMSDEVAGWIMAAVLAVGFLGIVTAVAARLRR
jgi:hypothetical protein